MAKQPEQQISRPLDLMIDFETLGDGPRPFILSMGAVLFDPYGDPNAPTDPDREMLFFINEADQRVADRRISLNTVMWWLEDKAGRGGESLRQMIWRSMRDQKGTSRCRFEDFPNTLARWATLNGFNRDKSFIWCRGTSFDIPILESLYDDANKYFKCNYRDKFWDFRNVDDVRSVLRSARLQPSENSNPHDPLADCRAQINDVQRSLAALNFVHGLAAHQVRQAVDLAKSIAEAGPIPTTPLQPDNE